MKILGRIVFIGGIFMILLSNFILINNDFIGKVFVSIGFQLLGICFIVSVFWKNKKGENK